MRPNIVILFPKSEDEAAVSGLLALHALRDPVGVNVPAFRNAEFVDLEQIEKMGEEEDASGIPQR